MHKFASGFLYAAGLGLLLVPEAGVLAQTAADQPSEVPTYHEFTIDDSAVRNLPDREAMFAATTYLFGVTAQEPFRREKVEKAQPAFYDYLKALFGPSAGNYAGSLTR